jgi:hypothetical protein
MYDDFQDDWERERCACDPELVLRRSMRGDTLLFQVQVYAPGVMNPDGAESPLSRALIPGSRALSAPRPSSVPQNLTGWFLQFTAKNQTSDQDSQAVAISKTTGTTPNVITFPRGAAAGLVLVSVGSLNTITLADGPTRLVYDVIGVDGAGNRSTLERGLWTVRAGATRATSPS